MEDADFERVAYYDPAYQTGLVHDPPGIARHLALRHGFIVLDAQRLAAWMKAVTARDASKTVCVMLQGYFPDTVAERKSPACTARRYLDAGGRLVSVGDFPFYQIGDASGGRVEWGNAGHEAVLGVKHVWGDDGDTVVTEAGKAWGLVLADAGVRCSLGGDLTALRTISAPGRPEPQVATWHKVYDPRHPLQGFLRYRGGPFGAKHWNAQVNELARLALRGFEEPFVPPESWRDSGQEGAARVVFSDPRYASSWSEEAQASAARLASGHGFAPRDAEGLAGWMRAQTAAGAAGSVAVILHGVAPDTVFDGISPHCLARRYLDAGGRLVWAGDVPFFYRGRPDGSFHYRNDAGTHEAVLDIPVRHDWEAPGPPTLTDAGRARGMTSPDEALRCVDASAVTEVLAGVGAFASSWLKTYCDAVPGSGFLRFHGGAFKPSLADELAAVALHGLPERAAVRAAAAPAAVEGERTGGGAFVVDRERALAKLMKFMLPSPELFLLPLARVAAASGAGALSLSREGRDLVVFFEGEPLPPQAVLDPFAAVTAESPDPRLRAWGLAILTALRARPTEVGLRSVGKGAGAAASVFSTAEVVPAPAYGRRGTEFRLVRPKARLPPLAALRAMLAARAPGFGEPEPSRGARPRGASAEIAFDDGAVRGVLRVPSGPRVTSNLLVCVQGVGAATVSFVLEGGAPVDGWVNDDRLGLNASLNGVVRDERLEAVRDALSAQLPRLARVAAGTLDELAAARAARLSMPGMADLWARALKAGPFGRLAGVWGALARGAVPDAQEASLAQEARLVLWLRESAAGLCSSWDNDREDAGRALYWKAPLFTAADGSPLTLEALERFRRRDGRVLVSPDLRPGSGDPRPVTWAPAGREEDALRRYFGDDVQAAGAAAGPGREGGALESAGLRGFLVREAVAGGEVGLRLRPDRPGLRVHGLKDGLPDSFHVHQCRLRMDAALEGPADAGAAQLAASAADRLYRLLASSFSCPVSTGFFARIAGKFRRVEGGTPLEREAASLAHLRDYLAASVSADGPAWPRSVPLFESSGGWLSHDALAAALERDGVVVWVDQALAANTHMRALGLDLVFGRAEGDARMPGLFKGLERCDLGRNNGTAWFRVPARVSCAHQAPFGCLAEGVADGAVVHLAVSPEGQVELHPVPAGKVRTVSVEGAGRLAYDAALAVALRAPQSLGPGAKHPWRGFVLEVAARDLAPWPGKPEAGALRAALFGHLAFQARWGYAYLPVLWGQVTRDSPTIYVPPGGKLDVASYILTEADLRCLRALWPEAQAKLMTPEEWDRYGKALTLEKEGASPEARARALAAARPHAAVPARARGADSATDARTLLKELAAASGSWTAAAGPEFFEGKGKDLLKGGDLSEAEQAAYLVSLAHSALNRSHTAVTDANDAAFQAALAAWAAERATGL